MNYVLIEGGNFLMGSTQDEISSYIDEFSYALSSFEKDLIFSWFDKQTPKHQEHVDDFLMSQYLVTNKEYHQFETDFFGGTLTSDIKKQKHPVKNITFFNATAFCEWLSRKSGANVRLPTESEWEFAASSRGKYTYPWGNQFKKEFVNTLELGLNSTSEVGVFSKGKSEQGIFDLAGNLEEWTSTMYSPYRSADFIRDHIFDNNIGTYPVLRGGSYALNGDLCISSRRHGYRSDYPTLTGFRCVTSDIQHLQILNNI